MSVLQGES